MTAPSTNKGARDYYYREIAPEEQGASYQTLYLASNFFPGGAQRTELGNDAEADAILRRMNAFVPHYSNDMLLDKLMYELIGLHADDLQEALCSIFVGKRRNIAANATAFPKDADVDVNLVLFNVGLSDAAYQYAILFDHFTSLPAQIKARNYGATAQFRALLERVVRAQSRWDADGLWIQLELDDFLGREHERIGSRAADIATCTDRFILGHEIAHHLLGHTLVAGRGLGTLHHATRTLPTRWNALPQARRDELEADIAAIGLMLGTSAEAIEKMAVTVAIGALLTMTILGQLVPDPEVACGDHPAVAERFLNVVECLTRIQIPDLDIIVPEMLNFQQVLHRAHGRGLGRYRNDVLDILKGSGIYDTTR